MPSIPLRSKRSLALAGVIVIFLLFLFFDTLQSSTPAASTILPSQSKVMDGFTLQDADLKGHTIMPKLGNETAKAELGRAAWKVLHTVMARFPDEPTKDESAALKAYIHLFQRLYPCGECATHFRKILDKYPPQVASRSTAAAWACHVHNEVNKSLNKDIFDCSKIGDFYDCGCAEDEADAKSTPAEKVKTMKTSVAHNQLELAEYSDELPELRKEGFSKGG